MGNFLPKNKKKDKGRLVIDDVTKIHLAPGYMLLKIASYNINLKNSINIDSKVKDIIGYIVSNHKNKRIDILCIQGLRDQYAAFYFIQELKRYIYNNSLEIYLGPEFEDVDPTERHDISKNRTFAASWNPVNKNKKPKEKQSHSLSLNKHRVDEIQNIIISRYPIINTIYSDLDYETDVDDVLGVKTVLGANISVNGNILSVYNTELSKDIRSSKIINDKVRSVEIDALFKVVNQNYLDLKGKNFKTYHKTDIHFLAGTFYIQEQVNNELNNELSEFLQAKNCVDIFRFITDTEDGYTTPHSQRFDYILFCLTKDIFEEGSLYYNSIQKVRNYNDIMKIAFKRYMIHFIDSYVRDDLKHINPSGNYPIETIFMMNRNKH